MLITLFYINFVLMIMSEDDKMGFENGTELLKCDSDTTAFRSGKSNKI